MPPSDFPFLQISFLLMPTNVVRGTGGQAHATKKHSGSGLHRTPFAPQFPVRPVLPVLRDGAALGWRPPPRATLSNNFSNKSFSNRKKFCWKNIFVGNFSFWKSMPQPTCTDESTVSGAIGAPTTLGEAARYDPTCPPKTPPPPHPPTTDANTHRAPQDLPLASAGALGRGLPAAQQVLGTGWLGPVRTGKLGPVGTGGETRRRKANVARGRKRRSRALFVGCRSRKRQSVGHVLFFGGGGVTYPQHFQFFFSACNLRQNQKKSARPPPEKKIRGSHLTHSLPRPLATALPEEAGPHRQNP